MSSRNQVDGHDDDDEWRAALGELFDSQNQVHPRFGSRNQVHPSVDSQNEVDGSTDSQNEVDGSVDSQNQVHPLPDSQNQVDGSVCSRNQVARATRSGGPVGTPRRAECAEYHMVAQFMRFYDTAPENGS